MQGVKDRGYGNHNPKESKQERKDETKQDAAEVTVDDELEEDPKVPLVTHMSNKLHSIFSIVEVYINNQQIYNSDGLYAYKSSFFSNFNGTIFE